MKSMTGCGRGQAHADGMAVCVEVNSVNRKQADLRINLPRELNFLEAALRSCLQQHIKRGAMNVSVSFTLDSRLSCSLIKINGELIAHLGQALKREAARAELAAEVRIGELLQIPGVIQDAPEALPVAQLQTLAMAALDEALQQWDAMRVHEGLALAADLNEQLQQCQQIVDAFRQNQDKVLQQYNQRLHERMQLLVGDIGIDDERLAREAAFLAERSDVNEEVVRLQSHMEQVRQLLAASEPTGRRLDFLAQEMGREINTLGAKTSDTAMSHLALDFKANLDRIREQVQNVE